MFEKKIMAGWREMDANSHMANTAYLDKSGDVRFMFFAENGFPIEEFMRRRVGPVVQKDEIEYFKEIYLLEEFSVNFSLAGLSEDGSRFLICNEFFCTDGKLAARVTSKGGWLDLSKRELICPPKTLLNAMSSLSKTKNFKVLPSSVK